MLIALGAWHIAIYIFIPGWSWWIPGIIGDFLRSLRPSLMCCYFSDPKLFHHDMSFFSQQWKIIAVDFIVLYMILICSWYLYALICAFFKFKKSLKYFSILFIFRLYKLSCYCYFNHSCQLSKWCTRNLYWVRSSL